MTFASRKERATRGFVSISPAILHGGVSTVLALVPIAFSQGPDSNGKILAWKSTLNTKIFDFNSLPTIRKSSNMVQNRISSGLSWLNSRQKFSIELIPRPMASSSSSVSSPSSCSSASFTDSSSSPSCSCCSAQTTLQRTKRAWKKQNPLEAKLCKMVLIIQVSNHSRTSPLCTGWGVLKATWFGTFSG